MLFIEYAPGVSIYPLGVSRGSGLMLLSSPDFCYKPMVLEDLFTALFKEFFNLYGIASLISDFYSFGPWEELYSASVSFSILFIFIVNLEISVSLVFI